MNVSAKFCIDFLKFKEYGIFERSVNISLINSFYVGINIRTLENPENKCGKDFFFIFLAEEGNSWMQFLGLSK